MSSLTGWGAVLGVLAGLAGCEANPKAPTVLPPDVGLAHPVAGTRVEAIREVCRSRDTRHVPGLIDLLDDPDAEVRLLAGACLEDLTGRDTGYRAHAGAAELHAQATEWRAWWAARSGGAAAPAALPTAPPPVGGVPPPPPPPRATPGAP